MSVEIGMRGRAETAVSAENTAQAAGSGTLPVFATPWMCALMERAAWTAAAPALAPGESSVGVSLNISHLSATPIGLKVWAEAQVTAAEGRKIDFKVSAYDESGLIGEGTHRRVIVRSEKFLAKAAEKAGKREG